MKHTLARIPGYYLYKNWQVGRKQRAALHAWDKAGRPAPPPHLVKQAAIRDIAERFGTGVLVETGTYYGDMIEAMKSRFSKIYSIELDTALYELARMRFRNDNNVTLLQGDSGDRIAEIVRALDEPALFWLDGHYSGGVTALGSEVTPVIKELEHILGNRTVRHVIMIDDARCFGHDEGYPTIDEITAFVQARTADVEISVQDDCIRILPAAHSN